VAAVVVAMPEVRRSEIRQKAEMEANGERETPKKTHSLKYKALESLDRGTAGQRSKREMQRDGQTGFFLG
jgi:hypothetical protein